MKTIKTYINKDFELTSAIDSDFTLLTIFKGFDKYGSEVYETQAFDKDNEPVYLNEFSVGKGLLTTFEIVDNFALNSY